MSRLRWLRKVAGRAQRLTETGQLQDAGQLLMRVMSRFDPITARPDADLIGVAMVVARCPALDEETRLLWARYAYQASRLLVGDTRVLSLHATAVYAKVCGEQGLTFDVVWLCEQQVAAYRQLGRPGWVVSGLRTLALALHDDGQCEDAEQAITEAVQLWCDRSDDPRLETVVTSAAVIAAGCGRTDDAVGLLRDYAPAMDELTGSHRQVTARWLAVAELVHPQVCSRRPTPGPGTWPAVERRQQFWLTSFADASDPPTQDRSSRDAATACPQAAGSRIEPSSGSRTGSATPMLQKRGRRWPSN